MTYRVKLYGAHAELFLPFDPALAIQIQKERKKNGKARNSNVRQPAKSTQCAILFTRQVGSYLGRLYQKVSIWLTRSTKED